MELTTAQRREIARYEAAYKRPNYKMGNKRRQRTFDVLTGLPRGSLLDVGAGRGEGVKVAQGLGFQPVVGVEPVEYLVGGPVILGVATDLPFNDAAFDTVMCLDVLEHLLPEDVEPALLELRRVAKTHLLLTAADQPHRVKGLGDLHISRRPIDEWHSLFERVFVGDEIEPQGMMGVSPGWLIKVNPDGDD